MKNNITKMILSVAFGAIITSSAMASEEDYGDDIFVSESNIQEVYISTVSFDKRIQDETSFLDLNYLSND